MTAQPEESPSPREQESGTPDPQEPRLVRVQFPRGMTAEEIARFILGLHEPPPQQEGDGGPR